MFDLSKRKRLNEIFRQKYSLQVEVYLFFKFTSIRQTQVDRLTFLLQSLNVARNILNMALEVVHHALYLVKHSELVFNLVLQAFNILANYQVILQTLGLKSSEFVFYLGGVRSNVQTACGITRYYLRQK